MDDDEIEEIHEAAATAGQDDWFYGKTPCPYPVGSEQAEVWNFAYRNAYAQENGY